MVLRCCVDENTLEVNYYFDSEALITSHNGLLFDVPDETLMDCYEGVSIGGEVQLAVNQEKATAAALRYEEAKWATMREERDRLLRETDFTQLGDAPFDNTKRNAYMVYRAALRGLPDVILDIDNFVWPTPP